MTTGQILPKPKLLIVDDDEAVLAALSRVLKNDFVISTVPSISSAIKLLASQEFSVIVSDQRMPDGSGLELLQQVAQIQPQCVRVLLSGALRVEELSTAINNDVLHRCLLKPWDNEHLRLQLLETSKLHGLLQRKDLLERLATTDPVTDLHNHRYFHDRLNQEVDRATRHKRDLSLVMMDLDNFKLYNDTYGHLEGDRLLQQIAKALSARLRNIDCICRYGGDEFALIMPDTDRSAAQAVAQRLRAMISDTWSESKTGRLSQTLSFGVASLPSHTSNARDLIQIADRALFAAKNNGRNQVC